MEGVEFQEEDSAVDTIRNMQAHTQKVRKTGFLTRIAISTGLTKDEQGAQYLLLVLAVVLFLATAVLFLMSGRPAHAPATAAQVQADLNRTQ